MTTKQTTPEHDGAQLHSEQLISDFKAFMMDAEELIKATAIHEEGSLNTIRSKASDTLNNAKQSLSSIEDALSEKATVVAKGADEFVHQNPWEAIGIAVGLGLLIGLFIRR